MSEHMLWETIDEQKRKIADLEQDLKHKKIAIQSRNAKIKELEAQIEKMKCCEMCKHKNLDWKFSPICEARDKIEIENPWTCKCEKWEIKEK